MSWRIANECAERRFGSAARKQIIMFLADKASDDGSGIWCSKGTIQHHTELSESTVKRTIIDFLREGILIETGRRQCKNGYTVIHRMWTPPVVQAGFWTTRDCGQGTVTCPASRCGIHSPRAHMVFVDRIQIAYTGSKPCGRYWFFRPRLQ